MVCNQLRKGSVPTPSKLALLSLIVEVVGEKTKKDRIGEKKQKTLICSLIFSEIDWLGSGMIWMRCTVLGSLLPWHVFEKIRVSIGMG